MAQIKVASELFVTDIHVPDHDPKAWSLTLQITRALQPEMVWIGGDFLDFKSVSKFLTNPAHKLTIGKDLAAGKKALWQLREAAPNARMIFREGNHDRRMQNFLFSKAPELADLEALTIPQLLTLNHLKIEYLGGDARTRVGYLWHIHGDEVPTGRVFPARQALSRLHDNVIFGHVHRFSIACESSLSGTDHAAWSVGCLQNLKVDYDFHTVWQQGIARVDYTRSGLFAVTPIQYFRDGGKLIAIVGGKQFSA